MAVTPAPTPRRREIEPPARNYERPRLLVLSRREREVLALRATGLTYAEVAAALFVSPRTVKCHLYHAYQKLGVRNTLQAVRKIEEKQDEATRSLD